MATPRNHTTHPHAPAPCIQGASLMSWYGRTWLALSHIPLHTPPPILARPAPPKTGKCEGLMAIWRSPYACHEKGLSPFPTNKGLFRWLGRGLQEQCGDIGDGKEKGMNRALCMRKSDHNVSCTRSTIKLLKAVVFVHEARNMRALVNEVERSSRLHKVGSMWD